MSLLITQRPQKEFIDDTSLISKWNAVWHPCVFKFYAHETPLTFISQNVGAPNYWDLTFETDDVYGLNIGDTVHIYFESDGVVQLNGLYTLTNVGLSLGSPPATQITITVLEDSFTLPVSTEQGGMNIISDISPALSDRSFYKIQVRVLVDDVEITDAYAEYTPNTSFMITADLQVWLQSILTAENLYNYTNENSAAPNLGRSFNIQIREYWKEAGFSAWSDIDADNLHYISNSVRQTGDEYGQNMMPYVVFVPNVAVSPIVAPASIGKFMTMFEQPTKFEGYPFDLSFIYEPSFFILGMVLKSRQNLLDIDKAQLGGDSFDLIVNTTLVENLGLLNRMRVGYFDSLLWEIESEFYSTEQAIALTERSFEYLKVKLYSTYALEEYTITEEKFVRYNNVCHDSPVYLAWLNPLGGFDHWLFESSQDVSDVVTDLKQFEQWVEDIGEANARKQAFNKDIQEEVLCVAENLTTQQAEGLRYLGRSVQVLKFTGYEIDGTTPKWQVVNVKTGTFFVRNTGETRSRAQFVIQPPQAYNQRQ